MTTPIVRNGTPSLSIPASQNTAPVLEFNCLYTHDVRRKQKRWQDGFLRFHTFNRRIMVYDVPRNFIGDAHWKEEEALQEGDELSLEKVGVLVEVSELVGRTETDLTDIKKKKKSTGDIGAPSPARAAITPDRRSIREFSVVPGVQMKHRSLNALLGTPQGRIGKAALPTKSPFELRHAGAENSEWEHGGPPKRQRLEAPWSVTRTTTAPKPRTNTTAALRTAGGGKKKSTAKPTASQPRLKTKDVIELSDDEDDRSPKFLPGFSSDAVQVASSPVREVFHPNERNDAVPMRQSDQMTRQRQPQPQKHAEMDRRTLRQPATPAVTTNEFNAATDIMNEQSQKVVSKTLDDGAANCTQLSEPSIDNKESRTILRLPTIAPRKRTLACQAHLKPDQKVQAGHLKTEQEKLHERLEKAKSKNPVKRVGKDCLAEERMETNRDDEYDIRTARADEEPDAVVTGNATNSLTDRPPREDQNPAKHSINRHIDKGTKEPLNGPKGVSIPLYHQSFKKPPQRQLEDAVPAIPERALRPGGLSSTKMAQHPQLPQDDIAAAIFDDDLDELEERSRVGTVAGPVKRKVGIGRMEVRKSAAACFPKAMTAAEGMAAKTWNELILDLAPADSAKTLKDTGSCGPWSREAFDLFTWRPPGWDEDRWCLKSGP